MAIKGWVYIITNKAMPDLVKVGYTLKDPALRAMELANTGIPYPYCVEYEVLLVEPRTVEQAAHSRLATCRAGGEWFRCSVTQAVEAIRTVAGFNVIVETLRTNEQIEPYSGWSDPLRAKLAGELSVHSKSSITSNIAVDVNEVAKREAIGREQRERELAEAEATKAKFRRRKYSTR